MRSIYSFAAISVFVVITVSISARAQGTAPYYEIHQEYTSTRALGMGNAFVTVVDDHSALFYNPAALANRKDTQYRMFLRAGTDADAVNFYNDIKSEQGGSNSSQNEQQIENTIAEKLSGE